MENASGENLNWFFKAWFYSNENIDLGIDTVEDIETGYKISFENKGMPMPVEYGVYYTDGTNDKLRLPVEVWQRGDTWTTAIETDKEIKKVVIDPNRILLDVNPENNRWEKPEE